METTQTKYYNCFTRTWWRRTASGGREPGAGKKRYVARHVIYDDARDICKRWNDAHEPGFLSKKCEFEEC